MTKTDPTTPETNPPPETMMAAPPETAKVPTRAKRAPTKRRTSAKTRRPSTRKATARKPSTRKPRARKTKVPGTEPLDVPVVALATPDPVPTEQPVAIVSTKSRSRALPRLAVVLTTIVVALAAIALATQVNAESNAGTIKVHDGPTADPDTRNEPHVSDDFWVEGMNMAADGGSLEVFSWPPTGNKELVLTSTWSADDGEPANHFLAGPYFLPCGHYRAEAGNGGDHVKVKMFWVEDCDTEQPPCGTEGQPPCPCGTEGQPPCPCGTDGQPPCSCGTEGQPPCQCGTEGQPPCPCGTEGQPPCPCGTEGQPPCACGTEGQPACPPPEELACPTDLTVTANGDESVKLTWTSTPGSDGTNVYRAEAGGDFEYVTTVGAGVGTYTDTTSAAGNNYAYMVTALEGNEESEGCSVAEVTAIPVFPTAMTMGLATLLGAGAYLALAVRRKA